MAFMNERLLSEIDRFLASSGMGQYRFGLLSVRNGRLVDRLRGGGRVWPETEAQVRAFIIANSNKAPPRAAKAARPEVAQTSDERVVA